MIEKVDRDALYSEAKEILCEHGASEECQTLLVEQARKISETLQHPRAAWRVPIRHAWIASGRVPPMITNSNRLPIDRINPAIDVTDDSDSDPVLVPDQPEQWLIPTAEDLEGFRRYVLGSKEVENTGGTQEQKKKAEIAKQKSAHRDARKKEEEAKEDAVRRAIEEDTQRGKYSGPSTRQKMRRRIFRGH